MSHAARSLFIFGIYLLVLGVVLLFVPNILLALFGLAPTNDVWIRVVGMLVLFLGIYDIQAARAELTAFFRWSVPVRASVIGFFVVFVASGLAPAALLLFGLIDLLAATWTSLALRQDAQHRGVKHAPPNLPM